MKSQVLQMKLVCKTPFHFISCLSTTLQRMSVWITDMYSYILSWTRLAHMIEGLIELEQELFHLIVRVLN